MDVVSIGGCYHNIKWCVVDLKTKELFTLTAINFENAKHRTARHKKAECDVHYSKFSFFSGAT